MRANDVTSSNVMEMETNAKRKKKRKNDVKLVVALHCHAINH